jgi:DHA1 family tetracycline resistance protein-like MFS transporter
MIFPLIGCLSIGFIAVPTVQSYFSKLYPEETQGELLSILGGFKNLTMALGPLTFNNLFAYFISDKAPIILPGKKS